jgi:hypothetical protein
MHADARKKCYPVIFDIRANAMTAVTFTSTQFKRSVTNAKQAANLAPVIITEYGKPAYILLSFSDYAGLSGDHSTLGDLLAYPGTEDLELPLPKRRELAPPIDLD